MLCTVIPYETNLVIPKADAAAPCGWYLDPFPRSLIDGFRRVASLPCRASGTKASPQHLSSSYRPTYTFNNLDYHLRFKLQHQSRN
ncbi:hypothetical protein HBH56_045310 [Parastagonospora nodorum]|uniref:Uncharacterized protein n=1 Tax=Phaeosphaeria nodorum (strain SN15 / ATCC MYA-4574 / FGSC 10173) TaxID=321614 RepID=A0A7U2HVY2_PHANO|nr:hypothetical protein HBH56_045310 [Parastagonospora nodorum]QRC92698.1 hypothetical protein JI435_402840 [Parastagonospora nodorum SN15]KAH3933247.1 hypothetical protein HBH54_073060 [Parastagonospora nodorum]KAH3946170.1 hypothetical protein HBH53_132220 [Parastagonospora nodorum]KAH3973126.1 hypothetical protein HBH52_145100 [Parastagonospora nodorum]